MRSLTCSLLMLMIAAAPAAAQPDSITIANVSQLASVQQIDFASAPAEAGTIESGVFAMNADGTRLAVRNRADEVVIFADDGVYLGKYSVPAPDGLPMTVIDTAFNREGTLSGAILADGASFAIGVYDIAAAETNVLPFPGGADTPIRLWFDAGGEAVWVEAAPAQPGEPDYVVALPLADGGGDFEPFPAAPNIDPEAVARVGRIPPPYAVTSSERGIVRLWNLQTGESLQEAQVSDIAMFGGINTGATHFAWRDPLSQNLHLLEFESGQDRLIDALDGAYISYIMVSPAADVILGVHVADAPNVVAWDVTTGARAVLGEYRQCNRSPDMARLSADGATLVIGCDSGLDVWQVVE